MSLVERSSDPTYPIQDELERLREGEASLQSEINALKQEMNFLHRRDETLNFYMHRLDEELRLAARLQQDFLPKSLPQLGPIHFHTLFRPAVFVRG
jgi:serine phosphatase RsbU (regulator of sigma subunit)